MRVGSCGEEGNECMFEFCMCWCISMSLLAGGVVLPKSSTSAIWGMILSFLRGNFMGSCLGLVYFSMKMKRVQIVFVCVYWGISYNKLIYCFDLLSSVCKVVVTISYTLLSISIIVFRFYLCLACFFFFVKHSFWDRTKMWYFFTFPLLSGCYCMVYILLEA